MPELADTLVDGLSLAEQAGLPVVSSAVSGRAARPVTSSMRPRAPVHMPGLAWLPGAGQGQGEGGERRVACRKRRIEPFALRNGACL